MTDRHWITLLWFIAGCALGSIAQGYIRGWIQ